MERPKPKKGQGSQVERSVSTAQTGTNRVNAWTNGLLGVTNNTKVSEIVLLKTSALTTDSKLQILSIISLFIQFSTILNCTEAVTIIGTCLIIAAADHYNNKSLECSALIVLVNITANFLTINVTKAINFNTSLTLPFPLIFTIAKLWLTIEWIGAIGRIITIILVNLLIISQTLRIIKSKTISNTEAVTKYRAAQISGVVVDHPNIIIHITSRPALGVGMAAIMDLAPAIHDECLLGAVITKITAFEDL